MKAHQVLTGRAKRPVGNSFLEKFILILTEKSVRIYESVLIAVRVHLFPSRTQKLSSPAPKILGWRRPGKIGNADTNEGVWSTRPDPFPYSSLAQLVEHAAVNRRVVGSSPTGGARSDGLPSQCVAASRFRKLLVIGAFSSVGQSSRLITGRSRVRVPEGPP